jgi:hypothetical protein
MISEIVLLVELFPTVLTCERFDFSVSLCMPIKQLFLRVNLPATSKHAHEVSRRSLTVRKNFVLCKAINRVVGNPICALVAKITLFFLS